MTTITGEYMLPSKGNIYAKQFDPIVKLRSMTVEDEMKRLNQTMKPYKAMCDLIDGCLETKLPYSSYDLCLADYQFLIHKLRVVTYGPDYSIMCICPVCGNVITKDVQLDELETKFIDETILDLLEFELPMSHDVIKLKLQTPRDLDWIQTEKTIMLKEYPDMADPTAILVLRTLIDTINGRKLDKVMGNEIIKQMSARDMNKIIRRAERINNNIGINTAIPIHCDKCGLDTTTTFRYTDEFFRPAED